MVRITRRRVRTRTGDVHEDVTSGLTSLAPDQADAGRRLPIIRQHWHREHRCQWVREVTDGVDQAPVRVGRIPQVLAARRKTVLGLLRATGHPTCAFDHV